VVALSPAEIQFWSTLFLPLITMRVTTVFASLALVAPAFGAPTLVPIIKRAGPVKANSYIMYVSSLDDVS
jgi:hypothetical protein